MQETPRILRTEGAARYVGLKPATLEKLRLIGGGGPRFIRLGVRAVGYDVHDLDAWIEECRRASAAKAPAP